MKTLTYEKMNDLKDAGEKKQSKVVALGRPLPRSPFLIGNVLPGKI